MGLIPIEPRSVTKTLVWKGLTRLRNLGISPRASRKPRSQTANRMTTPGRSVNHRAVASASFSVEATLFTDTAASTSFATSNTVAVGANGSFTTVSGLSSRSRFLSAKETRISLRA